MGEEIALFAVGSDGSVPQWDGEDAARGVMLRWLQRPGAGFPDYGYDLYRSAAGDPVPVAWEKDAAGIKGARELELHGGGLVLRCAGGLRLASGSGPPGLVVAPGRPVTVEFPDPAWYLEVGAGHGGAGIVATIESSGVERGRERLEPGGSPARWRTRGIESLRLEGEGRIDVLRYHLLHAPRDWTHLAHLCLPVDDPAYPCGPASPGGDEALARSRVPAGVDWDGRYGPEFPALRDQLRALATGRPAPAGGTRPTDADRPGDPRLTLDPEQAVALAALDPHIARAIGLAWDDDLAGFGLDGREWAYRIGGRWRGQRRRVSLGTVRKPKALARGGVAVSPQGAARMRGDALELDLTRRPVLELRRGVHELLLAVHGPTFVWEASGVAGATRKRRARRSGGMREVSIAVGEEIARVTLRGVGALSVDAMALYGAPTVREAILPSVFAREPGPPPGPAWIEATPGQPGGAAQPVRAALRWDVALTPAADLPEGGCVLFQPARAHLDPDPDAAPPPPPPFEGRFALFDGDPVLVPRELATATPPEPFVVDRPLAEGWHAWWVRGVDLFGRASDPSQPDVERVEDLAAPPPPELLTADYAQADLSGEQALLRGRTSFAAAWLADHPSEDAAVVAWAWTPELEALCPDVDGFRLYARRRGSDGSWEGAAWGGEIASIGPVPTRLDGRVDACSAGVAGLTVTAVEPIDAEHARCVTDLSLDAGAGALAGAVLRGDGVGYAVTGNGDGPAAAISVEHPSGSPPAAGGFDLHPGTTHLTSVVTDISPPPLSADPHRRRAAGLLVSEEDRLLVLGMLGDTVVARLPADPAGGEALSARPVPGAQVSWYPAYAFAIADSGFGPDLDTEGPVAQAQVTVRAVRRSAGRAVASEPAPPGLLTAVDVSPPAPPALPAVPSGERCAPLAEPADWFGVSRFVFRWAEAPGADGYVVYRAMGDALWRADWEASGVGPAHADHAFPDSELPEDAGRRSAALADLAALDAALRGGAEAEIAAAYEALRSDAQRLIAGQASVEHAYTALTGSPLPASARDYEDRLDGKSGAHWFYRVAARSGAGVEGAKSPPTPPICCPDVVPPQAPRAHLALAGAGRVTLRWAPNAEVDLREYELLRAADAAEAAEERRMTVVARLAPSPAAVPAAGQELPERAGPLLEHSDAAPGGREWLYRLVAIDRAGNRSAPSKVLRATSLRPIPAPPTLAVPTRTASAIRLEWAHEDSRLACLVERRSAGGGLWRTVSPHGWLPRGVYSFEDEPPVPEDAWEYRVRVKDAAGQLAPIRPTVTVPAA